MAACKSRRRDGEASSNGTRSRPSFALAYAFSWLAEPPLFWVLGLPYDTLPVITFGPTVGEPPR